jgi:hypothetical protein
MNYDNNLYDEMSSMRIRERERDMKNNHILTFSSSENYNFDKRPKYNLPNSPNNDPPQLVIETGGNSISNEIRISNLERRLDNAEKMLKFYEEMFRLKEEEKKNELKIDHNKILDLSKSLVKMEENQKILNRKIKEQNDLINEKFELIEKKLVKFNDTKSSVGEFYANKLAEIESMYNKNDLIYENMVDEKVNNLQINTDNKLEEILQLLNDISKNCENNEFNIVESRETIRMIQNDHLNFIKIVSILKEKADSIDYLVSQITELKQRYNNLIQMYNEQSVEEDKFLNKIINDGN